MQVKFYFDVRNITSLENEIHVTAAFQPSFLRFREKIEQKIVFLTNANSTRKVSRYLVAIGMIMLLTENRGKYEYTRGFLHVTDAKC